jgi:kynurenine formamidase
LHLISPIPGIDAGPAAATVERIHGDDMYAVALDVEVSPMLRSAIAAISILVLPGSAFALDPDQYRLVDLTHPYNAETIYWPTSPSKFELEVLSAGQTPGGWYYSANSLCTPEHGGTHFDAPIHFNAEGSPVQEVALANLMGPGVLIDVSAKAAKDPNYRLTADDVLAFEKQHGRIAAGSIVLLRTGWSTRWPDTLAYLGDDTPGDASRLRFPSYGAESARLLVEERGVTLIGVDTASIDHGPSKDFIVHRIAAARDVGGLENLTGLEQLPPTGFVILALPMKIDGGSGAPVRVIALLAK